MALETCTATYFTDGGRTERTCGEHADVVCHVCGISRCENHAISLDYEEVEMDGTFKFVCGDCR